MRKPKDARLTMVLLLIIFAEVLFADGPYEKWHVEYGEDLRIVLNDIKGILTINSGANKKGSKFVVYSKIDSSYEYEDTLNVMSETVPVSNFGWHPPVRQNQICNYRFPILDVDDKYVHIIYDAKQHLKAWLRLDDIESCFVTTMVMFDEMKEPLDGFVAIFYFTMSGNRKLYTEPYENAKYRIISKDGRYGYLKMIAHENNYIQIARATMDYRTGMTTEPLGWIRIWDDNGMLTIWIYNVDFY
jgi:hypothetical protein